MAHALPKVLVPVQGVPMIERVLQTVSAARFQTTPVIVVGHRRDEIRRVVGSRARFVVQTRPLGTGHAVRAAERLLKGKTGEVIVVYGDSPLVRATTLRALVALRRKHRAAMSLVTFRVPDFRGSRRGFQKYGRIVRDASGKLLERCVEYKDATPAERRIREVNSGFYCFDAAWLWKALSKIRRRNASGEYYLTDLMGMAVADGRRVVPYAPKNWREGIGANTRDDVVVAERELARR